MWIDPWATGHSHLSVDYLFKAATAIEQDILVAVIWGSAWHGIEHQLRDSCGPFY